MSLIEEALRRLQDPLLPPTQTSPEKPRATSRPDPAAHSWPTTPPAGAPRVPVHSRNVIVTGTVTVVALTALLVGGGMLWLKSLGRPAPTAAAPSVRHPVASAPRTSASSEGSGSQPAPTPARRAPAVTDDPFVLSGVVEGLGTSYAVINGAIVEVGDRIGGATLVEIGRGAVTLRLEDGSDVVRSLPH